MIARFYKKCVKMKKLCGSRIYTFVIILPFTMWLSGDNVLSASTKLRCEIFFSFFLNTSMSLYENRFSVEIFVFIWYPWEIKCHCKGRNIYITKLVKKNSKKKLRKLLKIEEINCDSEKNEWQGLFLSRCNSLSPMKLIFFSKYKSSFDEHIS